MSDDAMPIPEPVNNPASPGAADVPSDRLPQHIAVIMDGNGRWAQSRGLPRIEGHRNGAKSVRRTLEECARLGIPQLTLYCLSSENWKRPQQELDFLMHLLQQYVIEERSSLQRENVRLSVIGRREGLPPHVLEDMDKTIEMSRNNTGVHLRLAINYGGRGEIVDAAKQIASDVQAGRLNIEDIDEKVLSQRLYTADAPDPDLLIRTAGEMRISNFLLWQISYAEVWVTDVFWPDFTEDHLQQAIRDFASRSRRFGGLNSD